MSTVEINMKSIKKEIGKAIVGKDFVVELMMTAILTEGHILLESVPGSGKTKLARSFAEIISGEFRRIQFTPDVLPSDVTGIRFFDPKSKEFVLRPGPISTNVLLADEINRATPKTQSSLLEAMEEQQATIDGQTVKLPEPFLVIATQNPVESNQGTFQLPEAQLDRFLFKIDMEYPSLEEERQILDTYRTSLVKPRLDKILGMDEITHMKAESRKVKISSIVRDYLLNLVRKTREHIDIELGISTRGALALMRASQSFAFLRGKNFVSPEDVKQLAPFVFEHRLVLSMEGSLKKTPGQVVTDILSDANVPVEMGKTE
ncbi:AAA family ATPase [Sediminibacillus massiliensis]|uniref:AAA family ATPase n=1 Tax=Sediminibacillus massiliensis TaxID=1926277 RepID=UPI0009888932|nr:MoxR family ATPase [Sediminibacillus massiliensis]